MVEKGRVLYIYIHIYSLMPNIAIVKRKEAKEEGDEKAKR